MYFKKLLAFSTAITLSLGAFAPSLHAVNPGEDEGGDSPTLSTHDPDHDPTAELALSKIKRYIATWTGNHPTDRQNDTEKFIQRFIDAVTTADNATFIEILTTIRNTESLDRKLTSSRFSRDQIYDKIQNILGEKTDKDEKTRRRAGSVVLPDYRAESKEFIKPLREHAGDWKAHYGSYIVSDSTGIEGCIDALCKALCEDEQFVNAFHMSWRHNRVYIKDSLTNTDYEHLRMVIANILDKDPPQRKVLLRAIFDCTMKAITEGNIAASSFYFNAHSVLGHMDDLFPKRPAK